MTVMKQLFRKLVPTIASNFIERINDNKRYKSGRTLEKDEMVPFRVSDENLTLFKVYQGCTCEQSKHELKKYPRPGIKIERLYPGDIVVYLGGMTNFYGSYKKFKKLDSDYIYYINHIESYDKIGRI